MTTASGWEMSQKGCESLYQQWVYILSHWFLISTKYLYEQAAATSRAEEAFTFLLCLKAKCVSVFVDSIGAVGNKEVDCDIWEFRMYWARFPNNSPVYIQVKSERKWTKMCWVNVNKTANETRWWREEKKKQKEFNYDFAGSMRER